MEETGKAQSYSDLAQNPVRLAKYWHHEIKAAKRRRDPWMTACKQSLSVYRQDPESAFNVHHSNVNTRASARFNSSPIPDVRPTHMDRNEVGESLSSLIERGLTDQLDQYDMDAVIRACVFSDEINGQAQVRLQWDVDAYPEADIDPVTGEMGEPRRVVRNESVKAVLVPHGHYLEGPALTWGETPWVAYKEFWTRQKLAEAGVPKNVLEKLSFSVSQIGEGEAADEKTRGDRENVSIGHEPVWQIWHKETRTVVMLSEECSDTVLMVDDEPIPRLPGFFPSPCPLQCVEIPGQREPMCPYTLYKSQAESLDTTTQRIHALVGIMRYRGIRASELDDLLRLEELDDGQFIASQSAMSLIAQGGSLDNAVWIMPLDKLADAVRELINAREAIKSTVFEITGIGDVLRGVSDPRETAKAQDIKSSFGSLRITDAQTQVARFIRDILRLKSDIIATHFSDETLARIDGVDPNDPQAVARFEATLEALRDDQRRRFRVDVETDSTIRGDVGRAQQNVSQFLDAASRFSATFVPLIERGVLPAEPVLQFFGAIAGHFKLGKQVERAVDSLMEKVQVENEKTEAERPEREARDKQIREVTEEMAVQGQQLELQKKAAEAAKTGAEAEAQQIETQQHAVMGPAVAENWVQ